MTTIDYAVEGLCGPLGSPTWMSDAKNDVMFATQPASVGYEKVRHERPLTIQPASVGYR
jgi:hypothetical protein